MSVSKIFLDLDGVLVNWVGGVIKLLNLDIGEHLYEGWDDHLRHSGLSDGEFWAKLDADPTFWYNLLPYDGAKEFYQELNQIAPVYICSSPSADYKCHSQKIKWCVDHLGIMPNKVILMKDKHFLAKQDRALIDDAPHNINKFTKEGGIGLMYKQPWNKNSHFPKHDREGIINILRTLNANKESN